MDLDAAIIAQVARHPDLLPEIVASGVTYHDFSDEDWQKVWRYILRIQRDHNRVPSIDQIESRFEWADLPSVKKRDLPIQLADLKKRHEHNSMVRILQEAVNMLGDPDDIDDVRNYVLSSVNSLSVRNGKSSIVDLFTSDIGEQMIAEIRRRKAGEVYGIPTGLKKFDAFQGGLVKGRFVTTLARTGIGKTWINLLIVREAVIAGSTVMLFPLEMTLYETAMRLYTLFSARIGGQDKVLKNLDLQTGAVSMKKVVKFLALLEDRYAGQLYVADMGSIQDPFTIDRIRAEASLHPETDLAWIDYIQLMQSQERRDANSNEKIKELSNGCVRLAQSNDIVVGVSAQANRQAITGGGFLPEAEHVGLGDTIGHDSDHIFSFARRGKYLWYGLTKNRHGPSIGKTRLMFFPNEGLIEEAREQEDEREK